MPIVELKALGRLTVDQKRELADKITALLEKVAGKPKEYTYVLFEEIDSENWAHKGKLFKDIQ